MADRPEQQLPPWEGDSLSSFMANAAFNERVSALNLPNVYGLLKQVHSTFDCVAAARHSSAVRRRMRTWRHTRQA